MNILVELIFATSIVMTIAIYAARFRMTLRGLHQISLATWVMYFVNAVFSTVFVWQVGSGIYLTLNIALNAVLIGILLVLSIFSYKKFGHTHWSYKPFDMIIAIVAGLIIVSYYLGVSAYINAVALWLVTRLAELPTTRKVRNAPFSEIVWVDVVGATRAALLFFTLAEINIVGIVNTLGSAGVMLLIAGWCYYNKYRIAKINHKTIKQMTKKIQMKLSKHKPVRYKER
ncbi:hypothetical protein FWF93_00670 [Candidatus Saccharibacteria bacterium]|nr:hypothetical protein [Candidatus Saccharibacteria bacterium]